MIFTRKLTVQERGEILGELFGFSFHDVSDDDSNPHFVLYDDNGDEFYSYNENLEFNFDTLRDIFKYVEHFGEERGYSKAIATLLKGTSTFKYGNKRVI